MKKIIVAFIITLLVSMTQALLIVANLFFVVPLYGGSTFEMVFAVIVNILSAIVIVCLVALGYTVVRKELA